jgi:anaerobic selenocysteine-containing dehydrogenase
MTTRQAVSFCRICAGGCGLVLELDDAHRILSIKGDRDNPMSRGHACFKGLQAEESHHGPERRLHPLKRQPDGSYIRIDLEQVLDEIAGKLGVIINRHGPEAAAVFCGNGAFFNATAEAMHKSFLEAIGSTQYFSTLTIDQSAKYVSFGRMGGWAAGIPDFEKMDVLLFIGSNPLVSHGGIGILSADPVKRLKEAKARGLKLIVVDPRRTETAHFADLFVQPIPGQDTAILGGLIRLILEQGWEDKAFCDAHVDPASLERLRAMVAPLTPDYVEARAGLEPGDLASIAEMFARDGRVGVAYSATGINMTPFSNLAQQMLDCLNVICGRLLREGEAVHRRNVMSPPMPALAQVIPPLRPWEADGPSRIRGTRLLYGERPTGTLTDEILTPGEGQIRALIIDGGDPMSSFPDQRRTAAALDALELSVSIDPWPTATARRAHYVLPPTMQFERADMPMNLAGYAIWPGGWAQYTPPIVPPPEGAQLVHDWQVFWSLAKRLGKTITYAGKQPLDMDTMPTCDDLLVIRLSDAVVSLQEVRAHPHGHDFGTGGEVVQPAMDGGEGKFDLLARDVADELEDYLSRNDRPGHLARLGKSFTHVLSSRRMRNFFNGNGVHVRTVRQRDPWNPAYLNPEDFAELGLAEGQRVELETAFGRTVALADIDPDLRRGVITLAHGWAGDPDGNRPPEEVGTCVNLLIDADREMEAINAMPHFSGVPVNIRPLP